MLLEVSKDDSCGFCQLPKCVLRVLLNKCEFLSSYPIYPMGDSEPGHQSVCYLGPKDKTVRSET